MIGSWVSGKRQGVFTFRYANGREFTATFQAGQIQSNWQPLSNPE